MSPIKNPWIEIPKEDRRLYKDLVKAVGPAVRMDPSDPWLNFRVYYRIAILKPRKHTARVQIAYHYVWDAPTLNDIKRIKPNWVKATRERHYQKNIQHDLILY